MYYTCKVLCIVCQTIRNISHIFYTANPVKLNIQWKVSPSESVWRNVYLCAGEEGRLAYEQLDTVPREMVRLGTRRGTAVTTAFWEQQVQKPTLPFLCPTVPLIRGMRGAVPHKTTLYQGLMHRSVLTVVIIFFFYHHSHYYWCSFWLPFNYWLVIVEVPEFALVRGMYIEHILVVYCVAYPTWTTWDLCFSASGILRDVFNLTLIITQSVYVSK